MNLVCNLDFTSCYCLSLNIHMYYSISIGPIYRLNLGMGKKWVIIGSPTVAHEILVANGSMTAVRPYQRPIHDILTLGGK